MENEDKDNDVRETDEVGTLVVVVLGIAVVFDDKVSLTAIEELTCSVDCMVECDTGNVGDILVFGKVTLVILILGITLDALGELILIAVEVATIWANVTFFVDNNVDVLVGEVTGCIEVEMLNLLVKFVEEKRLDSVDRSRSAVLLT